jgi:tyrosine-protein kinase Etk/Wzc
MENFDTPNANNGLDNYRERLTSLSKEFDFGRFTHVLRRSILIIILLHLMAGAAAFLYLRYTAPVYEAKTTIQFGQHNNSEKVLATTDLYEDDNLAAKLELLRSRAMLHQALLKLPLEIGYYREGSILTMHDYRRSNYEIEVLQKCDSCIAGVRVDISFPTPTSVELHYVHRFGEYHETFNSLHHVETPHMKVDVRIRDYSKLKEVQLENKLYFVFQDIGVLADQYFSRLRIKILNPDAKTVSVAFEDNCARLAKDIVDTLAFTFIVSDVDRKGASAQNIIDFIDDQLADVLLELCSSEDSIQLFKRSNDITANFGDLSGNYLEKLSIFEGEIQKCDLELTVLNEINSAMKQNPGDIDIYTLIPLLMGSQYEGAIGDMITDMSQLMLFREEKLFTHNESSEYIQSIDYRIKMQAVLIMRSVESARGNLQDRKNLIISQKNAHVGQFDSLPYQELEYSRLQRIFTINEEFYTLLLKKKAEYSISKAGFVPENEILAVAKLPSTPIAPDKKVIYASFIMLGVFLSIVVIAARYLLHTKITSLNDITNSTSALVNVLGIIPKYTRDIPVSQLLIYKNPKSLISEAFRTVRSNLQFINNDDGAKTIAVTSTISGEGKTFVAINLAGIIAYSGKKVVILDLDMRKPKVHIGFGVDNLSGMSTLLIGKDKIENCINHSNLENLDFITAGPAPPNPSELIISGKLESLVEELKKSYEIIIFDNPPVGLVTDAIPIIQKSDYPIYIFRADYSKINFAQNVDRLINESGIKKLSVILNGVDIERGSKGYGYGYGYGYSQGYNYYDEDIGEGDDIPWYKRIFKRKA